MEYKYNVNVMNVAVANIIKSEMLLVGGNGGSHEQGSHFVAELTGSFEGLMNQFPAISMCSNTSELTAFANDFGYANIFTRYASAFLVHKPTFLFISTSGTSANVIACIEHLLKCNCIPNKITLLCGKNDVNNYTDKGINVITTDYDDTATIQEAHMHILHNMASLIKNKVSV